MKRPIKSLLALMMLATLAASIFTLVGPHPSADALSGSDFSPGRIIDDSVFFQPNSMTGAEIESFLTQQEPSCQVSGTYTCLKSFTQNTPAQNAISGICNNLSAVSNDSAADIISRVTSACGINPKVIIVLLQKEEGLVTDESPTSSQYQTATGYGCPDSSGCDTNYYGFFNQVYDASWQFKEYQANPDNFTYVAGQNNNILYNPNAACGHETVYIQNEATAALYNYTPYVPNAAALANVSATNDGGTGNSCSSYGNRNFWWFFNTWFGSTYGTPFFDINGGSARYVIGNDNNYYHVTSPDEMMAYGYGNQFHTVTSEPSSYLNGLTNSGDLPLITRFDGSNAIYLIDNGSSHSFPSQAVLNAFNYTTGQAADMPEWLYNDLSQGSQMEQVVKQISAPEIYYVQNGKKSHIIDATAYYNLGSPVYASQSSVTLSNNYVQNYIALGPPIMYEGTFVETSDTHAYGIWNGSTLQAFSSSTASDLGRTPDQEPSAAIDQLTASGTTLGKLAKDSNGNMYILDRGMKFVVTSPMLANLGLNAGSFVTTDDTFLANLPNANLPTPTIIRVNNGSAVYLVSNGNKYAIPSRADFDASGYNMGNVVSVNPGTFGLFGNTGEFLLSDDKLVRVGNEAQVYLIDYSNIGGFHKLPIASRDVFNNYGYNMNNVYSIPADQLNGYVTVGNLPQLAKDDSGNIWLIDSGVRHLVSGTMQGSSYYNINPANVLTLSGITVGRIRQGADLTDYIRASGPAVYKVANGTKEMYTSATAFGNDGGNWSAITQVSDAYAASLPNGSSIN